RRHLGMSRGLVAEAEGAALLHFARGADERAEGDAAEAAAEADALDAGGGEDVDGLAERGADLAHRRDIAQARRVEDVGPRLLEGLKAADRVLEIGPAMEEILGARRQREGEGQRAGGFDGGGDAL